MSRTRPTPADLRGEVARRRVVLYRLAARVGLHPGRLGSMLNGRVPLPPLLSARILEILRKDDARLSRT